MVCATSKGSDQPAHTLEYSMSVKLLTERHLELITCHDSFIYHISSSLAASAVHSKVMIKGTTVFNIFIGGGGGVHTQGGGSDRRSRVNGR